MLIYVLGAIAFGIFLIYILFVEDKKDTEQSKNSQENDKNKILEENENNKSNNQKNMVETQIEDEKINLDKQEQENKISAKFNLIVFTIKVIGYIIALFSGLVIMVNVNFWGGLILGLVIAIVVFFSTLIYEALAEIINLLQDIKNKL